MESGKSQKNWEECKIKRMQHGNNTLWKGYKIKKVYHEASQHQKSKTWRRQNMKKVQKIEHYRAQTDVCLDFW